MKAIWKADALVGLVPGINVEEKCLVEAEDRDAAKKAVLMKVRRERGSNIAITIRGLEMI